MTNAAPNADYKGELVELDAVEQALAGLRKKYGTVPDVTTKEGYDATKKAIRELTGYRTKTNNLRLAVTEPHREFVASANEYGNNLIEQIKAIEEPLKAAKKNEDERAEREKQERIAKLRERINVEIWSFLDTAVGLDSNGLADLHDAAVAINTDGYFDVSKEAEDAKAEVLKRISELHGQTMERERLAAEQAAVEAERRRLREEAEKREADQRELEELRREKAEREAAKNRKAQPEPKPEPQPEPLPAAAEHKPFDTRRLSTAADNYQRGGQLKAPAQVTISQEEYDQLLADQAKLHALEAMGVDNWSGYAEAMQQLAA